MSEEKKLNGTVIVTYRCNARCSMCNRYKAPSKPEEEISIETIKKLPKMYFTNITGGEPFIRTISFRSVRMNGSPPVILVKYIFGSFLMVSMLISSSGLEGAL